MSHDQTAFYDYFSFVLWEQAQEAAPLAIVSASHDESKYKCDRCPFQSNLRRELLRHRKTHIVIRVLKCAECDYTTCQSRQLKRHAREHYTHFCAACDWTGRTPEALAKHEGAQKCRGHASYSARSKYSLTQHQRNDKHDQPFQCSLHRVDVY